VVLRRLRGAMHVVMKWVVLAVLLAHCALDAAEVMKKWAMAAIGLYLHFLRRRGVSSWA